MAAILKSKMAAEDAR